jgi:hypothetical protein
MPPEKQEEPDGEFPVRLTPGEMRAASKRMLSSLRGDLSGSQRHSRAPEPEGELVPWELPWEQWPEVCPILKLQSGATRKLYFRDTTDGLGSRVLDVVGALIFAEKMNLHFAGIVTEGRAPTSHGVAIAAAMSEFFGFVDVSDLYLNVLPSETQSFSSLGGLQEQLENGAIGDGIHVCVEKGEDMGSVITWNHVSPTILAALRDRGTPLMQMPLRLFQNDTLNVAVHIRREDVDGSSRDRGTSDGYYLDLMDIMRGKMPHAKFHVFSSLGGRHKSEEFDYYRNWGATVHLDTEARETLAHMAKADVLVTAHSSFSYVSALLNPNCVLHQAWMAKMPRWVQLPRTELDGNAISQIASCMISASRKAKQERGVRVEEENQDGGASTRPRPSSSPRLTKKGGINKHKRWQNGRWVVVDS